MSKSTRFQRRDALRMLALSVLAGNLNGRAGGRAWAEGPRALQEGMVPDDSRLGPLLDLNGYFPFEPSASVEAWRQRAERVRRQILVAAGLWPMPTAHPIDAVVHGPVDRDEYTVERVFFESFPGLYVTGSLYRPKGDEGRRPAILSPHGHWPNGRFHDHGENQVQREIEAGAERFEVGGRHPLQARCVQLARMGCVVFLYDMLGYADSVPIPESLAHGFRTQRPELSRPDRWGLFSAQAELRLQNVLGLQLYNSIRALDWLSSLPDVDPDRIGVTGASGGGTQTFLLAAIDDRPAAAFPAVMVSTAMQGGCTCENASYLRVETGNIEFAALSAPRPLGLTGANDWTREIETKGLPELKRHYELLKVPDLVIGKYFDFGHNFNAESRALMYQFFNTHLNLGIEGAIEERDYEPLSVAEATVWTDEYPRPDSDVEAEVALLRAWDEDSNRQLEALTPTDAESLAEYRRVVGGALEIMIGRSLPEAGAVVFEERGRRDHDDWLETTALLRHEPHGEAIPAVFFYPKDWGGRVVLWVDRIGKQALLDDHGEPIEAVGRLLAEGISVVGADLLYQGEFLEAGEPLAESRRVENEREFAGYTLGYNHPLFAQRVHDILTLLSFIRHHEYGPKRVDLVALNGTARWASAAVAVAGPVVEGMAAGTDGFRFDEIDAIRDPDLLPGAVKYGDLPFLLALCAPTSLWLSGEGGQPPDLVTAAYRSAGASERLATSTASKPEEVDAVVSWLLNGP